MLRNRLANDLNNEGNNKRFSIMRIIFLVCVLFLALGSCSNNGNSGRTGDTSVNGATDSVNTNGGGSGMTGPTTGTSAGNDTAMQQRMNDNLRKDSVR